MASNTSGPTDAFDIRKIRRLVELMCEHDLSELDLQQADNRIKLRRGAQVVAAPAAVAPAPATRAPEPAAAPAAPAPAAESASVKTIKSPMVGTFYVSSSPGATAFVKVGDHVAPDTTVCIVEAMKVFNEIPAEIAGKVVAVLVQDGEPVEYGQDLFKIDTAG